MSWFISTRYTSSAMTSAAAAPGVDSRRSSRSVIQASSPSSVATHSPRAALCAIERARATPMFCSLQMSRTRGSLAAMLAAMSRVPSVEPSSTTMISRSDIV